MEREMCIRNYSEKTNKIYLCLVRMISNYFKLPPGRITNDQLKNYLYHLINIEKCSTSKINQIISAWKILQQDILGRDWEQIRIKRPRRAKKLPVILSRDEALRFIDCPTNIKHRALLTLAYTTGMRKCELLSLPIKQIDRSRKIIKVNGKGNKQREVFMPDNLCDLLEKYCLKYHPLCYLFEGRPKVKYSESSVSNIVKQVALNAGIKKKVTPHTLRHTFATHMLERGVNLKRLQLLMGHNSIKTTSIYLHLANLDNTNLPDLTNLSE